MNVETPEGGWRRMEKQRPQKPTEGDLKSMNTAEHFHLLNIGEELPDLFLCPAFVFWNNGQKNQLEPLKTKDTAHL